MRKWTSDIPEEAGFYFYHPKHAHPYHVWIAQVSNTRGSGLFFSTAHFDEKGGVQHRPVSEATGMWSGPIDAPPPCFK